MGFPSALCWPEAPIVFCCPPVREQAARLSANSSTMAEIFKYFIGILLLRWIVYRFVSYPARDCTSQHSEYITFYRKQANCSPISTGVIPVGACAPARAGSYHVKRHEQHPSLPRKTSPPLPAEAKALPDHDLLKISQGSALSQLCPRSVKLPYKTSPPQPVEAQYQQRKGPLESFQGSLVFMLNQQHR